ncbi:hypothetical protein E2C01_067948 [Portunus trituberculatus]|uniref:Uncharacterized protein n=1 Tax=Portunus trituberculatus TaxID=210409 RepID=A0A5B7HUH5_PORTR|nr:hypothetical protein [Portunus trituberculatus]
MASRDQWQCSSHQSNQQHASPSSFLKVTESTSVAAASVGRAYGSRSAAAEEGSPEYFGN